MKKILLAFAAICCTFLFASCESSGGGSGYEGYYASDDDDDDDYEEEDEYESPATIQQCANCGGGGFFACGNCQNGYVSVYNGYSYEPQLCNMCGGNGTILCEVCGGNGVIVIQNNVSFGGGKLVEDKDSKCETGNTYFQCYKSNGILASGDECMHCGKCYCNH